MNQIVYHLQNIHKCQLYNFENLAYHFAHETINEEINKNQYKNFMSRQVPLTPHMPNSTEDVYHLVPRMPLAMNPATLRFYPSLAYLPK